ncbi:hypothetical protein, partial [Streptomyces yangpuensis]|uniref:hypothetical protein n=1 Tax=Streptomyces yangpuensis TaxID=1648182 RepID=UPI00365165B0
MPIDPYAALNAMLRAEVTRFAPPVRQAEPTTPPKTPAPSVEDEGDPQRTAAGGWGRGRPRQYSARHGRPPPPRRGGGRRARPGA